MQWQPIETAPKDGTPVLLYRADRYRRFGHVQASYWRRPEDDQGYVGWG